jgi:hypothetical protein
VVKAADSKSVVAALIGSNPVTPIMLKKDMTIIGVSSIIYIYLCYDLFVSNHHSTILILFPYSIIFSIIISYTLNKYITIPQPSIKNQSKRL